jgi:hypothetical protein
MMSIKTSVTVTLLGRKHLSICEMIMIFSFFVFLCVIMTDIMNNHHNNNVSIIK